MSEIAHRTIEANGVRIHFAEAGSGPLVILCHGFPESWYSWRHQLRALSEAGYHAVAPDMRGYGQTDRPEEIDRYTLLHLVGDMVGLVDALGADEAVIAGHDWGAPVAWHAGLLRPDQFRGVIGLSVPFVPRGPVRPTSVMPQNDDAEFYQLYFQCPGVAEAELGRDARISIRALLYSASGDAPRRPTGEAPREPVGMVPRAGGFLTRLVDPPMLVRPHGLSRRLELVSQHRSQLGAPGPVRRDDGRGSGALCGGRLRPRRRVPRRRQAHPQPAEIRPETAVDDHAARLRPLDPAGASRRGQRRDDRIPPSARLMRPAASAVLD